MTDRFKGFLITLEEDIRDDDAEPVIEAIKQIKGVLSVKPVVNTGATALAEYMAGERAKHKLIMGVAELIEKMEQNK